MNGMTRTREHVLLTNNIPQKDGGTHLRDNRAALTRTLNNYIEKNWRRRREKIQTTGDDSREGLDRDSLRKLPTPNSPRKRKDKLVSSEVKGVVGIRGCGPARDSCWNIARS